MGSRALPSSPDQLLGKSSSDYILHLAHRLERSPGCLRQITAIGGLERPADRIDPPET
jgi:hypothetical protein